MATSKEATVIIFDVSRSPSSEHQSDKGSPAFFEAAKSCIARILQRKIFSTPHDEVGLLLMGSAATDNSLSYPHISQLFDVQCTNWSMLRLLERELANWEAVANGGGGGGGGKEANGACWLDALVVALDMLNRHSAKKFKSFKVVLVTAFERSRVDEAAYPVIVKQLMEMRVDLVVITDQIKTNDTRFPEFSKTSSQNPSVLRSMELLHQLIEETLGFICDFEHAHAQLLYFEKRKQRTVPWNVHLEIGSTIRLAVAAYIQIKDCAVLGWKNDCKMHSKYYLGDRELDVDTICSGLIKGYLYGDEPIAGQLPAATPAATAAADAKCLRCIGFAALADVRDEHFAGSGAWSVVAQKADKAAASERQFVALVATLRQTRQAMIVRYVYRAGTRPKIMALFAADDGEEEEGEEQEGGEGDYRSRASLRMLELIYKDNITALQIPPLAGKRSEPSDAQLEAMDSLIDAMDLMDAHDRDELGEPLEADEREAFPYRRLMNPTLQHMYRVISHRALHPTQPVPVIDADLRARIEVPAKLQAQAAPVLEELRTLFPLELVAKPCGADIFAKLNQLANAGDANGAEVAAGTGAADAATAATDPADDNQLLQLVAIGTVTPDEDFGELLRRGERFSDLAGQMSAILLQLVLRPVQMQRDKVCRSMMVFREEAKRLGPAVFNGFVRDFRRTLEERGRLDVWRDLVVAERFGLIAREESEWSGVSAAEAEEFYERGGAAGGGGKKAEGGKGGGGEEEEEDDVEGLLDNM